MTSSQVDLYFLMRRKFTYDSYSHPASFPSWSFCSPSCEPTAASLDKHEYSSLSKGGKMEMKHIPHDKPAKCWVKQNSLFLSESGWWPMKHSTPSELEFPSAWENVIPSCCQLPAYVMIQIALKKAKAKCDMSLYMLGSQMAMEGTR